MIVNFSAKIKKLLLLFSADNYGKGGQPDGVVFMGNRSLYNAFNKINLAKKSLFIGVFYFKINNFYLILLFFIQKLTIPMFLLDNHKKMLYND